MTTPALELENVVVEFDGVVAVDQVNLAVPPGARHVILGPNGAGKSTLFATIGGQIRPKRGQIFLDGKDVTRLRPYERARKGLGRTFQLSQAFATMTVAENIVAAIVAGSKRRSDPWRVAQAGGVKDQLDVVLTRWSLTHLAAKPADSLSYGQRRLVEFAMATASDPRVLILDEPTAGVERSGVEAIIGLIQAVPVETSVIMIEHDMSVAFRVASEVTVMVGGKAVRTGPTSELRNDDLVMAYMGGDVDAYS